MSCFVIAVRGRVDEEQLSSATKAISRRVALCVSTFSPLISEDSAPSSVHLSCTYEFNQLLRALQRGGALPGSQRDTSIIEGKQSDMARAESSAEERPVHVVLVVSAKLRPAKISPQPCFTMDMCSGESPQRQLLLKDLGRMIASAFSSARTVTLLFNTMSDLPEERADHIIREFADGVMQRRHEERQVDAATTSGAEFPQVRGFVALSLGASTSGKLERVVSNASCRVVRSGGETIAGWRALTPSSAHQSSAEIPFWPGKIDNEAMHIDEGGSDKEKKDAAPEGHQPPTHVHRATSDTSGAPRLQQIVMTATQEIHQDPITVTDNFHRIATPEKKKEGNLKMFSQNDAAMDSLRDHIKGIWSDPGVIPPAEKPLKAATPPTELTFYCSKCQQPFTDALQHNWTCQPKVAVHAVADVTLPSDSIFDECRELIEAGLVVAREEVIPAAPIVRRRPPPSASSMLPTERWCETCGMLVNGDKNWQQHIAGEKHKRLTEKMSAPQATRTYFCTTCETKMYGETNLLQHTQGMKHLKAAEGRQHRCATCNVATTGDRKFLEHLRSMSHQLLACPSGRF